MRAIFKRSPEWCILLGLIVIGYVYMGFSSQLQGNEILSARQMWLILVGSFLFSTVIAIIAVIAGIGGGVLFTPVMLAFTSFDTLIIRATGLVVAMFSGLIATGPFMKKGIANIKLVFYCSIPIVIGGIAGAFSALRLHEVMGVKGDAWVRLTLGCILVFIATMFILGGSKTEYPTPARIDSFSQRFGLRFAYWEESLQKIVEFQVVRVYLVFLFFITGFAGGFFGLGGGWAVVPILNLGMAVPLKVSAACSGVLLAMSNSAAIWAYIMDGSLISVIAVPWMLGQVVGGTLGANILINIKAGFVRTILVLILFLTSIKLMSRGIEEIFGVNIPFF